MPNMRRPGGGARGTDRQNPARPALFPAGHAFSSRSDRPMKSRSPHPRHRMVPVRVGLLAALYLLLMLEVGQSAHGGFRVLFWVSAGTYGLAIAAGAADGRSAFRKLTTIGWATLGLGLNWLLGWLCAPL